MNQLRCDICGGQIEMQPDKRGLCLNCGTSYSLATMKEMFSGVKVSVTGSDEDIEQWRILVGKYYSSGDFLEAENIVKKILEALPNDRKANEQYDELQILKYLEIKNGVLKKYTGEAKVLTIPKCVKRIEQHAFGYLRNWSLITLYIPSTVEGIGACALGTLDNLKDVYFEEGFEKIDPGIFGYNQLYKLTVHLPKSCKSFPVCGSGHFTSPVVEATLPKIVWAAGKVTWVITNKVCENLRSVIYESRWELQLLTAEDLEKKKTEQDLLKGLRRQKEQQWRNAGLCQHCGGQFSGFFTSKCKKCGRAKDY